MVNSVMRILRYVIEKKSDCWLRSKSGIKAAWNRLVAIDSMPPFSFFKIFIELIVRFLLALLFADLV